MRWEAAEMHALKQLSSRFARDDRGATAIEYGLIAALMAVGALGGMTALGGGLSGSWGNTAQKISDSMKSVGGP
jgi:pilus assembly protein Flp/PilA